jgi:hypothetical protein
VVSVAAIGSVTSSDVSSTVSTSAPSGVVAGSLIVLVVSVRHATTGVNPTTPSGWTLALSGGAVITRFYVYWRYAVGDSTDTPTVNLGVNADQGMQAVILRLTGAATSSPVDATNSATGVSDTVPIPTVTVAENGSLALGIVAMTGSSTPTPATWPSPWNERIDSYISFVNRHNLTIAEDEVDAGTSAGGNVTYGASSTYSVGVIVFKPDAGGPSVSIPAIYSTLMRGL